jgi:hypothetical protein
MFIVGKLQNDPDPSDPSGSYKIQEYNGYNCSMNEPSDVIDQSQALNDPLGSILFCESN